MTESIYCKPNKYGYEINVCHPLIRPKYEEYKRSLGTPVLSDSERMAFENAILKTIERNKK